MSRPYDALQHRFDALPSAAPPRVLLVAENISARWSGETLVPWYYLRDLSAAGCVVHAICHARVRDDLRADLPADAFARVTFVEDASTQRLLFAIGRRLPYRVGDLVFNQLIHVVTQWRMRRQVRRLVREHGIDVVFQPAPIAPKAVSFLSGVGAPVVIGPMSGGMDLPPAFRFMEGPVVRAAIRCGRVGAALLHQVLPAKRRAAALIVANERTRAALPPRVHGAIHVMAESGVDVHRWEPRRYGDAPGDGPVRFVFCGRFVDWKGIGYLVDAFATLLASGVSARLDLVGDGELFDAIAARVDAAGIGDAVTLHGRLSVDQYADLLGRSDVFVTPSLRECGGMAMLEAMALSLPVVGVRWGGAAQYTDAASALLVPPASPAALVAGLADAMRRLAESYPLRRAMGEAARRRVVEGEMDWRERADRIATILRNVVAEHRRARAAHPVAAAAIRPVLSRRGGDHASFRPS